MPTVCVYYRDEQGKEPVREFLDATFPIAPRGTASSEKRRKFAKRRAKVDLYIDRMNGLPDSSGPLPYPWTSQLAGELREFRFGIGSQNYRILHQRSGNLIVLLHAIHKTTGAVPREDIDLAIERFRDFRQRMDANPRQRPRAAGSDAP